MKKQQPSILANEGGFTLIEIISVLVILGILAAVAVPKYIDLQDDAREKSAQAAIAEMQARMSMAYGKVLLSTGQEPGNIAAVCNAVDTATLPADCTSESFTVGDYTVSMTSAGVITVLTVQGVTLTTSVTGNWTLP